ncbi:MAG: hypothetical protein ABEK10_04990 [Candidatus Nanosalina sp.]
MSGGIPESVEKYGDLGLRDLATIFRYGEDSVQVFYMISTGYSGEELVNESNLDENELGAYLDELEERNLVRNNDEEAPDLLPKGEYFREGLGDLLDGYGEFAPQTLFQQSDLNPDDVEDVEKLRQYREDLSGSAAEVIDEALGWAEDSARREETEESNDFSHSQDVKDAIDDAIDEI